MAYMHTSYHGTMVRSTVGVVRLLQKVDEKFMHPFKVTGVTDSLHVCEIHCDSVGACVTLLHKLHEWQGE